MKRKRTITIEIERDLLIERRQRKIHVWCPACGADVEITIPPDAIENRSEEFIAQIVQLAQHKSLHTNHVDMNTKLLPPIVKT